MRFFEKLVVAYLFLGHPVLSKVVTCYSLSLRAKYSAPGGN